MSFIKIKGMSVVVYIVSTDPFPSCAFTPYPQDTTSLLAWPCITK